VFDITVLYYFFRSWKKAGSLAKRNPAKSGAIVQGEKKPPQDSGGFFP
jgi:hypothetical protein